jgi:hypothetical protein
MSIFKLLQFFKETSKEPPESSELLFSAGTVNNTFYVP